MLGCTSRRAADPTPTVAEASPPPTADSEATIAAAVAETRQAQADEATAIETAVQQTLQAIETPTIPPTETPTPTNTLEPTATDIPDTPTEEPTSTPEPAATNTTAPPAVAVATSTPGDLPLSDSYSLSMGTEFAYEPLGTPNQADICEAYRQRDFDAQGAERGLYLQLRLTNNSNSLIPAGWTPTFITSEGNTVLACPQGFTAGTEVAPGSTNSANFWTLLDADEHVDTVQLTVAGERVQLCLDQFGNQRGC